MWHTDYKWPSDEKMRLVSYPDDASRMVLAWGVFESATAANAMAVLDEAIARCGAPPRSY